MSSEAGHDRVPIQLTPFGDLPEEIAVRDNSKKMTVLETSREFTSHQPAVNWLQVDRENYKGRVTALPKRDDINLPVNEQLIVELYSK